MKRTTSKQLALVGLWTALIFVATLMIKFDMVTPTGPVMIKTSNALCLLGGVFFGKYYGGLAAGLGSMLFDLTNPLYVSSAPFTFICFFCMAYVAGDLFSRLSCKGALQISCLTGALTYTFLYSVKTVFGTMLMGSAFLPALIANLPKITTSLTNAVIALILSSVMYPVFARSFRAVKLSGF